MITPSRIEVRNIGSIGHAVVEPHRSGITALDGPTGAGKSTIVNAVVYALYGYVGGVDSFTRQAELRSDFCPDGEPAEASVEFDHAGQNWKVVRRLRRTKSGKEAASAELWIDGTQQLNMTPDRVTEKMTQLIGMTGKAFTSAFFIPQMHLEKLAQGTPADIQALIEEQAGLTPLTRRIGVAAGQARDAAAAADALPGSTGEVEEQQRLVDEAQRVAVERWNEHEAAAARAARAAETWQQSGAVLAGLTVRRDKSRAAELQLASCTSSLEAAREQADQLSAELATIPEGDVTGVAERRDQLTRAADAAADSLRDWAKAASGVQSAQQRVVVATQTVDGHPTEQELTARADAAHRAADEARDQQATARQQHKAAQAALAALQVADTSGHSCPMCAQPVADPSQLAHRLQADMADAERAGRVATDQMTLAEQTIREVTAQGKAAQQAQQQLAMATREAETAIQYRATVAAQGQAASTQLRQLLDADTTAPLGELVDSARAMCAELADLLAAAKRRQQMADRHRQLIERCSTLAVQRDELAAAAADRVDEAAWSTAVADEATDRQQRDETRTAASAAEQASKLAQRDAEFAERSRDAAQQRLDAKVEALTRADVIRNAHDVLVQQRRELLGEYTAAISAAASDVMEQVGGGRHVAVQLDETFVPKVVTADGTLRPFRNCSGGEKLRAALCLCLGQVAQQDQTGTTGMLFADEIATGYDAATTNAVIEAVANLGRPMLMIGHNESVRQVANRVYEVRPGDGQGPATVVDLSRSEPAGL